MERYCQSTPTQQQQAAKQGPIEEANESLTATFKLDRQTPDQELCGDCGRASLAAFPWVPQSQPPRVESGCSDELYLAFLLHFQFGLMPDPKAWRTVNPSPH
ncbi:hypothetical protein CCUS01_03709 [Colletotrichum cuscutae]|uniref:Uncharacterized protein n=1 Tax=Colletotrichum cuscutae TaxID=1209917 RepID=A0AAI9Y5W2_9PEZI|nr:hypothetical protein CCUS01_03709 [Colletotrichum cuscutae]